jgi:hypothetical protein
MAIEDKDGSRAWRLLRRALRRLWQLQCGLAGHDRLFSFGGDKTTLKCVSCGHETPGWKAQNTIRPRFEGDTERHRLK